MWLFKPKFKTYFLGELTTTAFYRDAGSNWIIIRDISDNELAELKMRVGSELKVMREYEVFSYEIENCLYKAIFISKFFAEIIRKVENEKGNHYQLVEMQAHLLDEYSFNNDVEIVEKPLEEIKIGLFHGLALRDEIPLLTPDGGVASGIYTPFSLDEKSDYLLTGKLPESYTAKLLTFGRFTKKYLKSCLRYQRWSSTKLQEKTVAVVEDLKKRHDIIRHAKDYNAVCLL